MDRFSLASGYLRRFYCLTVESRPQECIAQPGLCGGGRDNSGVVVGHRAWQGLPAIGRIERRSWFVLAAAELPTATTSLLAFRALSLGDASRVSPPIYPWHLRWFWQRYFQEKSLPGRSWAGALLMTAGALPIATAKPAKQPDAGNKNGRSETEATIYKTKPRA